MAELNGNLFLCKLSGKQVSTAYVVSTGTKILAIGCAIFVKHKNIRMLEISTGI